MNKVKYFKTFIGSFFLVIGLAACDMEEPNSPPSNEMAVNYVFSQVVTEIDSLSPIALPSGTSFDYTIINSTDSLYSSIPLFVVDEDTLYKSIDFSQNTLLSLKFLVFYNIKKIEYKAYAQNEHTILLRQRIYTSGSVPGYGKYVMSNLVTDKVFDGCNVTLEQSYSFE